MENLNFKSGFVSMLGRTNVGKSSIINALVGEKVAAVANKTQTTRTAIRAIVNRPNSQIIFVDTPGIHKPKSKLGNVMVETAFGASLDVDIIVFVALLFWFNNLVFINVNSSENFILFKLSVPKSSITSRSTDKRFFNTLKLDDFPSL